jgi:hypothetical protein
LITDKHVLNISTISIYWQLNVGSSTHNNKLSMLIIIIKIILLSLSEDMSYNIIIFIYTLNIIVLISLILNQQSKIIIVIKSSPISICFLSNAFKINFYSASHLFSSGILIKILSSLLVTQYDTWNQDFQ